MPASCSLRYLMLFEGVADDIYSGWKDDWFQGCCTTHCTVRDCANAYCTAEGIASEHATAAWLFYVLRRCHRGCSPVVYLQRWTF